MKYWSKICLVALVSIGSRAAAQDPKTKSPIAAEKPLTYANVVSSFKSAGLRTTEVQKRCTIFFEGEWTNANIYNYCVIMVENDDEDIQVTFYLTDAHEMNWVTEFIDSPFFTADEKQALFTRLNRNKNTRAEKIGRFKVDVNQWNPRHADIIVFSFTPLRNY
jgi:hypothetical protein